MTKVNCMFWHPTKGGWYYAVLIRKGYKWALVIDVSGHRRRVPAADIKAVK